jgi:pimeloyl-ACP methyl ester carboxylesterase
VFYFGACTGGGAVLIAAAKLRRKVAAVVSRGGRLDLATKAAAHVHCPTLLIVGENDTLGIELCHETLARLPGTKELVVVPGASHLFGEPGVLEEMARISAEWFHALDEASRSQAE